MKKLNCLFEGIEYEGALPDRDVRDIVIDSRKVRRDSLFVCVRGASFDGHDRAEEALRKGAAAVVTERKLGVLDEISVGDTRIANARLCAAFFDHPEAGMRLTGVTGTNGKTTVASLIKRALTASGRRAGLIGTIRNEIGEMYIPAKFTTPEPWDLFALLGAMRSAGCSDAVMEASSQALAQDRLYGLRFACAVFTNLTQDHLDYHGTMERYFAAKKTLFAASERAVVNIGDDFGRRLEAELKIPCVTYSAPGGGADYTAEDMKESADGVRFTACAGGDRAPVKLPIPGSHTVSNALAAAAALVSLGVPFGDACGALSSAGGISGRGEVLYSDGDVTVISDFAHTADAFRKLLSGLHRHVKGRMVTLFGCTGDRDSAKRPAMAAAAAEFSDFLVLSSDNPRSERPEEIIREVSLLLKERGKPFYANADREFAIRWALSRLKPGDLLLLCGKGHEDYQVLDGVTVYLNERSIVEEFFRGRA